MIAKAPKRLTVFVLLVLVAACTGGVYGVILNLALRILP
jgi:hypothetical protein